MQATSPPPSTASKRDVVNLSGSGELQTIDCLNLLPCAIKYDGAAKSDTYFLPAKQSDDTYEASFRGRQLFGCKIALPSSYVGHVLIDTTVQSNTHDSAFESEFSEESAVEYRELLSVSSFDALTIWEHDRVPPADDDEFISSLEWIDVAASIHADCSNENSS
ncbi:hypothetical protein LPJ66_005509 [Kickxella alabastrina]|uniref:Uncharacterized protein n=1 Tax=Kickxella alabastrina TaxID=61397 RepID=A0ACC1IE25_9FUNG|nr:hypothetical protein LPJ66_005509 [Kickxella alabastrina]